MRTDELHGELEDLAAELDPFAGDVRRVRGRVTRSRIAIGGALLVALALPIGVAVSRSDDDGAVVAGLSDKEVTEQFAAGDLDAIVFTTTTEPTATQVRAALDQSAAVDAFAFADLPSELLGFVEPFTCARILALVSLRDGSGALDDLAAALPDGAVARDVRNETARWKEFDGEIFLSPDASAAQIAAVEQALVDDPKVSAYAFVSKEAAYEALRGIFEETQPELVESTDPEILPPSFRVALKPGVAPQHLERHQTGAGVKKVAVERAFDVTSSPRDRECP